MEAEVESAQAQAALARRFPTTDKPFRSVPWPQSTGFQRLWCNLTYLRYRTSAFQRWPPHGATMSHTAGSIWRKIMLFRTVSSSKHISGANFGFSTCSSKTRERRLKKCRYKCAEKNGRNVLFASYIPLHAHAAHAWRSDPTSMGCSGVKDLQKTWLGKRDAGNCCWTLFETSIKSWFKILQYLWWYANSGKIWLISFYG